MKKRFLFLLTLLSLLVWQQSCIKEQQTKIKHYIHIIRETSVGPPIKFPTTYYVSRDFDEEHLSIMKDAMKIWSNTTNGIVKVDLEYWNPPKTFDFDFYSKYPLKSIWFLYFNEVRDLQEEVKLYGGSYFSGFSFENEVIIIRDYNEFAELEFKMTFMHEMGHQFGMHHIKKEYPALMNSYANDCITYWDLIQFCWYYNCKSVELLPAP